MPTINEESIKNDLRLSLRLDQLKTAFFSGSTRTRALNALDQDGIHIRYVGQLLAYPENKILHSPYLGRKGLNGLKEPLKEIGLGFRNLVDSEIFDTEYHLFGNQHPLKFELSAILEKQNDKALELYQRGTFFTIPTSTSNHQPLQDTAFLSNESIEAIVTSIRQEVETASSAPFHKAAESLLGAVAILQNSENPFQPIHENGLLNQLSSAKRDAYAASTKTATDFLRIIADILQSPDPRARENLVNLITHQSSAKSEKTL